MREMEWISVKDKLPRIDKKYLTLKNWKERIATFNKARNTRWFNNDWFFSIENLNRTARQNSYIPISVDFWKEIE